MPCGPFSLRSDGLTGADPGGSWSVTAGTYGGPALTGDNPTVNISTDIPVGQSVTFRYTGLSCDGNPVTADVTLLNLNIGLPGTNTTTTLCEDDAAVNPWNILGSTLGPNGQMVWTGDITNAGFSGTTPTATFDPSLSGIGTFTFTATVSEQTPAGFASIGCCDPFSNTITIIVEAVFDAGVGGSFAGC